jgi:two-component system, NarL family, response regulator DevR
MMSVVSATQDDARSRVLTVRTGPENIPQRGGFVGRFDVAYLIAESRTDTDKRIGTGPTGGRRQSGEDPTVKVLVGDHSGVVRSRLVARLRESGLDVVGEADSLEAMTSLAILVQPDAIVSDIKFADGRGIAALRAMRESAPRALLMVVSNTLHLRVSCLTSGADYFLDKSTEFDEVAPTLTRSPKR